MANRIPKPDPPIVLQDSREQVPLILPNSQVAALSVGDYSLADLTDVVAVERKSLADFYGCVAHEKGCTRETRQAGKHCQRRCRFKAELERLSKLPYPAIVMEASMAELLVGPEHSDVHPHAAIGSLIAWSVRYRIPVWLCPDRRTAAATVFKILCKAAEAHSRLLGGD